MFDKLKKRYLIMLQLDSVKEAAIVSSIEGYGKVNTNAYTEDLYRNNKVQLTIPTPRRYYSAARRLLRYADMGILGCIIRQ